MATLAAADIRPRPRAPVGAVIAPVLAAAAVFALHMALASRYGYFRDELYYIAASRHPAPGYFDFPAGVALVAWVVGHTLGYSLWALHLPPALAHAGLVLVAAAVARELGGDAYARLLAALATAVAPAFLGSASMLTMDVFDELCWSLGGWAALAALRRDQPRRWLLFGLAAAIGLVFKMTMLFFGAALFAGLLLSPAGRRHLATPWPRLAALVAGLGVAPYLLWQVAHGWPTLAFYAHYPAALARSGETPALFLIEQVLLVSPVSFALWLAGLAWMLLAPDGRSLRPLGWAYFLLLVLFAAGRAKVYFLAPVYPVLLGAGAVRFSTWSDGVRRRWRAAYAVALVACAGSLAPIVMPLLPPAAAQRYSAPLHVGEYTAAGDNPLIQPLADRFGWPQQVATVAAVWNALPAAERRQACIVTANYGEAAAIDFFGPRYGLPPAISGHNQYYLWGPGRCSGAVVVTVGVPEAFLWTQFGQVQRVAVTSCTFCVPEENGAPVDVSTAPRQPLPDTWSAWRNVS